MKVELKQADSNIQSHDTAQIFKGQTRHDKPVQKLQAGQGFHSFTSEINQLGAEWKE
jgi:hypothetical protein